MNVSPPSEPMRRALQLAERGQGRVEPNPMVGALLVRDGQIVGEGWHEQFGAEHAEINALEAAGDHAQGATAYVTLEPCSHHGKTPPCTEALVEAGITKVVIATLDPFLQVNGQGLACLRDAGIVCEVGDGELEALRLLAPYRKRLLTGRPWVIAKWAMSLDGKMATRSGASQWISGETSRRWVHTLRGRVDGILVGAGTLLADDPLLTARPPGARTATRIVLADARPLPAERELFRTVDQAPVLVAHPHGTPPQEGEGVESWTFDPQHSAAEQLLDELGRRQMTNLLVEGGAKLLGTFLDERLVDEVHAFVAPRLIGGEEASSPIRGQGVATIAEALRLDSLHQESSGEDLHLWGIVASPTP